MKEVGDWPEREKTMRQLKIDYNGRAKDIGAFFLFALVSVSVLKNNAWIVSLDGDAISYHLYPYQMLYNALFCTKELPLWMPHIWGGLTGINNINFIFSPLAYICMFLFNDGSQPFVGFGFAEGFLILHLWILQVGMYLLLKKGNISTLPALLGTVLCGVGSGTLCFPSWFNFTISLCYAPLILVLLVSVNEKNMPIFSWRNVVLGIAFSQVLLFQLAQGAVLTAMLWGLMYLVYVYFNRSDITEIGRLTVKSLTSGMIGIDRKSVV